MLLFLTDPDGELQWLKEAGPSDGHWPVVALAADADVETAVRAMKNGAFDFLLESCGDRRLSGGHRRGLSLGRRLPPPDRHGAVDSPPHGAASADAARCSTCS